MRLQTLSLSVGLVAVFSGCHLIPPAAPSPAPVAAPMPGSDTTTPHRSIATEIGTAIIQDLRDGVLRFDFTPDEGPTLENLRVRAAEIDDLRDTLLEPGVRLRLRLVREFLQLGTTTPREVSRRWEALRTR